MVVCEADEYDRSFHRLSPSFVIVTNVEPDHLEIYGDEAGVVQGFRQYLELLKPKGVALVHQSVSEEVLPNYTDQTIIRYGEHASDLSFKDHRIIKGQTAYTIASKSIPEIDGLQILSEVPGVHNIENAIAAAAVALKMGGLDRKQIQEGLVSFKGVHRRFNQYFKADGKVIIDDYAHHPTEIATFIRTSRKLYPNRKLTLAFQPHLYSRTRDFLSEFAEILSKADEVWLLPLYPAREKPIKGIDSDAILDKISIQQKKIIQPELLKDQVALLNFEVLGILGAGTIGELIPELV
jgi:UDP-N-acetylmuramate--alanine ligase